MLTAVAANSSAFATVIVRVDYCNSTLWGLSAAQLNRLQKRQNIASKNKIPLITSPLYLSHFTGFQWRSALTTSSSPLLTPPMCRGQPMNTYDKSSRCIHKSLPCVPALNLGFVCSLRMIQTRNALEQDLWKMLAPSYGIPCLIVWVSRQLVFFTGVWRHTKNEWSDWSTGVMWSESFVTVLVTILEVMFWTFCSRFSLVAWCPSPWYHRTPVMVMGRNGWIWEFHRTSGSCGQQLLKIGKRRHFVVVKTHEKIMSKEFNSRKEATTYALDYIW